jgi:hypothetical protein
MPVQSDKLDFSQPDNNLSKIAEEQRKRLFPRNDYKPTDQYSSVHPNAIADGDANGKGTGVFLDTINGGSSIDALERKNGIKVNEYQANKPYTTPSA